MMNVRDRVKELRRVRAGDLRPNPKNWRTHPAAQQKAMSAVLADVGYVGALIARELEDGTLELIDGHLRAETTPEMEVPVLILDVTAEEADKVLLTLDPIGDLAKANSDRLDELFRSVTTEDPDLKAFLQRLAEDNKCLWAAEQREVSEDDVPLPPDEPITKRGDLWILGDHRLLCGDSSKPDELDRLLDGAIIDLVNTDPPYNVKVEPRSNNAIAAGLSSFQGPTHHQGLDLARPPEKAKPTQKKMRAKDRPLTNDFMTDEAFDDILLAWFKNASRVLKPGGSFYIWGGYANLGNYPGPLKQAGLYFSQGIVWDKQHPVLTRKDFMGAFEICFYGWKEGAGHQFFGPNNATDLWHLKKVNQSKMVHLTEKPVELAANAIHYSSRPGENVLDLFGGSGSTLMACEQTGRKAFLMELDPPYCDVIVERYEKFTGKTAERIPASENTPVLAGV